MPIKQKTIKNSFILISCNVLVKNFKKYEYVIEILVLKVYNYVGIILGGNL